ncbi:MAG: hypothetical protein DDT25_00317 [Chloroflexi bacterium]|nr:hypothetical protein [Chloroflexota bacterium]
MLPIIAGQYRSAEKITLVMDNLNTHNPGSFYEVFPPDKAKALWDRFELVYTPKHGSWLNMAEIEFNVLTGQCLNRRNGMGSPALASINGQRVFHRPGHRFSSNPALQIW